jgi:hypothetical protein
MKPDSFSSLPPFLPSPSESGNRTPVSISLPGQKMARTGAHTVINVYCSIVLLLTAAATADATIVVDHLPDGGGVSISDTDFLLGSVTSFQQSADDFTLGTPATIRQIVWWGNYVGTTPSTDDTFRIRFYEAAQANGLPGNVSFEATILNAVRAPTGLLIPNGTGGVIPEYRFEANLLTPTALSSGTPHWLEIVQLGDPNSMFQWEWSSAQRNGFAFLSPNDAQWQKESFGEDLAFQLSTTPEPATTVFFALGIGLLRRRY